MIGTVFIIFGIVIVPMIVVAVFLLNGKGAFLIAGYNTMSKIEKEKYDEKAMCRFVGWLLIVISLSMLLFPIGLYFEIIWLSYFWIAFMLVGTIGAVIYMNTGNRFRNKDAGSEISVSVVTAEDKKFNKSVIIVVSIISAIIFTMLGVLLYQGGKDPAVNISSNNIQIESMYGLSVNFSDITQITLIEKSMGEIGPGRRISGYGGIGQTLKGNFKSDRLGEHLLFVQSKSSPTIKIERSNGKDIYISLRDSEKTNQLYREMIAIYNKT